MASMKSLPMTIVNERIDRSALSTVCRDAAVGAAPWAASRRSARIVNMRIAPTMISTASSSLNVTYPRVMLSSSSFKTG